MGVWLKRKVFQRNYSSSLCLLLQWHKLVAMCPLPNLLLSTTLQGHQGILLEHLMIVWGCLNEKAIEGCRRSIKVNEVGRRQKGTPTPLLHHKHESARISAHFQFILPRHFSCFSDAFCRFLKKGIYILPLRHLMYILFTYYLFWISLCRLTILS